jgi:hypothetical protein
MHTNLTIDIVSLDAQAVRAGLPSSAVSTT